ncbi:MAG: DUF4139 domain-containing protein [Bryobacteraceae bacterium]|jgi:hypothetical protein
MLRIIPVSVLSLATALAADLPVREVILYKSGVGYFARSGQLAPGEGARLDFKATDMNDVLKSLTVADDSGTPIRGLRYDSSEPLEQKLADFPFTIEDSQKLSGLLDNLRGARVELKSAAETLAGTIVSARAIPETRPDQENVIFTSQPEREQLTLLLDSGDLRTLDLAAVSSLRFPDPKLQAQLKDYLATVAQSRSKDKRSVYIDSSDAKARAVSASYIIPQPLWKSSYRLLFGEKNEATLEGWAIVDNTTGDDWTDVHLAVVSGRPVSFISRLYEPFYVQRTTADVDNAYAQAPVVYEGSTNEKSVAAESRTGGGRMLAMHKMAPPPPPPPQAAPMSVNAAVASTVTVATQTRELGDLFEYRFSAPVTIHKNESAMLPFLQQKIAARKLLIYSESYGQNPMSAAELTNNTGKTLDGGPITVFEGASYGGEALMNTVKNADKRLISYAVDLGTRVGTEEDSGDEHILEVHANRGVITTKTSERETKTYTIRNVDPKSKTLIVEQTIREEYALLSPKPAETTAAAHRFEVKLGPGATVKFPVVEEHTNYQTVMVTSFTPDLLVTYVSQKAISDAARKQLQQIVDQKARIASVDQSIRQTRSEMEEVTQAETRLRQNIATLNSVSGQQDQVQTWSRQLASQEVQYTKLRDQAAGLDKQKAALEAELNEMIAKLEF